MRASWQACADASPWATYACPVGWLDDFSEDIKSIDIPTLIIQGSEDRILPPDGQGRRLHVALPDATYVEVEGGPHGVCVTHPKEVNKALLELLGSATKR